MNYSIGTNKSWAIIVSSSYPEGRSSNSYIQREGERIYLKWPILISAFPRF